MGIGNKVKTGARSITNFIMEKEIVSFSKIVFLALFVVYMYLLNDALPKGVNKTFSHNSVRFGAVVLVSYSLLWLIVGIRTKSKLFKWHKSGKFVLSDLILMLLPLTPIVQYIIVNQTIFMWADVAALILMCLAVVSVLAFIVPTLLSAIASRQALMLLGLALSYFLFAMPLLSKTFDGLGSSLFSVQIGFFIFVFSLLTLLYATKNILNIMILVFFVSNTGINFLISDDFDPVSIRKNEFYDVTKGRDFRKKPDIYLLTFDGYLENETMLQYGIDNSAQELFLKDSGFKIYNGTYTTGAHTLSTMSDLLNVSRVPFSRYYTSGGGVVPQLLELQGYKTYGIFRDNYLFGREEPNYDEYTPGAKTEAVQSFKYISKAILSGRFTSDIEFSTLSQSQYDAKLNEVLRDDINQPKFVDTHIGRPGHSPFPTLCRDEKTELNRYRRSLEYTNKEMRNHVATLLESKRDSIIIIFGDHGGYLKGDCYMLHGYDLEDITRLHIQDRIGSFLAIRWPNGQYKEYDDITILQDLFPAIFAYLLEDRSVLDAKLEPFTTWDYNGEHITHSFHPSKPSSKKLKIVNDGVIRIGRDKGKPLFLSLDETDSDSTDSAQARERIAP